MPLSYVIREEENVPGPATTFTSFVEQTIASAPLTGTYYEAHRATVHQAIVSYIAGQPSEDWIKTVSRYKNGRRSMKVLRIILQVKEALHAELRKQNVYAIASIIRMRDLSHSNHF